VKRVCKTEKLIKVFYNTLFCCRRLINFRKSVMHYCVYTCFDFIARY